MLENELNFRGDIREMTLNLIKKEEWRTKDLKSHREKILLVDEVDVLFSDSFLGKTFNPIIYYRPEGFDAIFENIRKGGKFETVIELNEF